MKEVRITRTSLLFMRPPYPHLDWGDAALLAWAATQGFDPRKPIRLRKEGSPTVYIFEQDED